MIKENFRLPWKCVYPGDRDKDFIIVNNYYAWYYTYGKIYRPKSYMEIGVRLGYSTIAVGLGSKELTDIYLFDNNSGEYRLKEGEKNIKKMLPCTRIHLYLTDTQKMNTLNFKVDMAHIDGAHTREGVKHDLHLVSKCINLGGWVIIDDTKWKHIHDGVCDFLIENKNFKYLEHIDSLRGNVLLLRKI
jgi:predicted O-methyltransferase YrrM